MGNTHFGGGSGGSLRGLLAEAGWSGAELARAVNAVGTETGMMLRYGRASAAQWLSGVTPRPPVPALIAEALSRRLKRAVTPAETGLNPRRDDHDGGPADPVAALITLADAASADRTLALRSCVYSLEAIKNPGWPAAADTASVIRPASGRAVRAGRAEVDAAVTMLELLCAADAASGGSALRPVLADYLAVTIGLWLDAAASSRVRADLQLAAAKLAYLCGFMCFDDELQGLAQGYYRTGLQLSADAGSSTWYAVTLRSMSVQACALGHYRQGLDLAEAAVSTAMRRTQPRTSAFLHGQLAVAAAATGDRRNAFTNLSMAEHFLERAADSPSTVAAYHPASLAHQQSAVLAFLGDLPGAIAAQLDSVRQRPAAERRSRAITLARLAELQVRLGHLDEAVPIWDAFLDDYPAIRSTRARTALLTLRACMRPYAGNPGAAALLRRASLIRHLVR